MLQDAGLCADPEPLTSPSAVPVEGVVCGDGSRVFAFGSASDRDIALFLSAIDICRVARDINWVVGPNWLVYAVPQTHFEAASLQELLGGEVRTIGC